MFLTGLTGGIASGKSLVAERFAHRGAELVDADEVASEVTLPDTPTWYKIIEHFGEEVLDGEGFIDRAKLGRIVFADAEKRELLNRLTHPRVFNEIANRLELLAAFDGVVVLDVPLLVESGVDRGYEAIVVVAASRENQINRLVSQRGMAEDEARARVDAQAPLEDKLTIASHVIWNDGPVAETLERADQVWRELEEAARRKAASTSERLPDR